MDQGPLESLLPLSLPLSFLVTQEKIYLTITARPICLQTFLTRESLLLGVGASGLRRAVGKLERSYF